MEKTNEKVQQSFEKIAKKAEKEIAQLSDTRKGIISALYFSLMAQTKLLADEINVSHDSILLLFWYSIYQNLTSEQGCAEKKPKSEKAEFTFKPPKNGLLQ